MFVILLSKKNWLKTRSRADFFVQLHGGCTWYSTVYLADEAVAIFCKIQLDNRFIIQYIDNKAHFYCRKAGDDLYVAVFLADTQNYVFHRISVHYRRQIHHDHIWAVLQ